MVREESTIHSVCKDVVALITLSFAQRRSCNLSRQPSSNCSLYCRSIGGGTIVGAGALRTNSLRLAPHAASRRGRSINLSFPFGAEYFGLRSKGAGCVDECFFGWGEGPL